MSEPPDNQDALVAFRIRGSRRPQLLQRKNATRARLFFSVVLIAAGVLLFLSNLGILPIRDVWAFWPVLPLVGGIGSFTHAQECKRSSMGCLPRTIRIPLSAAELGIDPLTDARRQLVSFSDLDCCRVRCALQCARIVAQSSARRRGLRSRRCGARLPKCGKRFRRASEP